MREPHVLTGVHFTKGVLGMPALKLSSEALDILRAPCVYAWFRDGTCLYVGCTSNALARIRSHHVINVRDVVERTDEFHFFFGEGEELEKQLIQEWQPLYNIRGKQWAEKSFAELAFAGNPEWAIITLSRLYNQQKHLNDLTRTRHIAPLRTPILSGSCSERQAASFRHLLATLENL